MKCKDNLDEIHCANIFAEYWSTGERKWQQDYICAMVEEKEPSTKKRNAKGKGRSTVRKFHLQGKEGKVQVCKEHFTGILNISNSTIETALKYRGSGGLAFQERKVCKPSNKIPEETIDKVRKHIDSFPAMPSHYSRKDSKREYLAHDLSIQKMYYMYEEKCREQNEIPVKLSMYRRVFNTEFNLGFHRPKKDLCAKCEKYKQGSLNQEDYNRHQHKRKLPGMKKMKTRRMQKLMNPACVSFALILKKFSSCHSQMLGSFITS